MKTRQPLRIAVFASGRGTNLAAVLQAIDRNGTVPRASVEVVISNNSDSGALQIARNHQIPALHMSRSQYTTDTQFNASLLHALRKHNVNFIVLAGYMKKIDGAIIDEYRNHIVNIHPALLPGFGGKGMFGMRVHEAVIASKAPVSGATVHIVDDEYDRGPIIAQSSVGVAPDDTAETLAEKILLLEHELYPQVIKLFAEGRVQIDGASVNIIGNS